MNEPHWRRWGWAPSLYGGVLFSVYAALILVHPLPPPLGDFADWVYQGALLSRHLHGLPEAAHTLKHYPVPNSTATLLLGLLAAAMPWAMAAKIFLCLQLGIAWCAIRCYARAAKSPGWIWLVAPSGFFLNVNFWFGLIAFQLGMALLFFFLAVVLREGTGRAHTLLKAGLLLLLFFTHMVPFTFACLVVVCGAVASRRVRALAMLVPSALLLLAYTLGRFGSGDPDAQAVPRLPFESAAFFAAYKGNTLLKSFGFVNPGDLHGHSVSLGVLGEVGFLLLFLLNLLVCGGVLWMVAKEPPQVWRALGRMWYSVNALGSREVLWLAVLICLPVYLVLPRAMLGISDPGSRVLQASLYAGLFLCCDGKRVGRLIGVAAMVMAAAGLFLFARVAFLTASPAGSAALPGPVQRLAMVPYASVAGYYDSLDHRDFQTGVFPTGLFTNERARR